MATDIAIIPGKSFSERINSKNLVDLNGKPLISWTIESAIQVFSEVIVSTDSPRITAIAKGYGCTVAKHPKGDVGATAVCLDVLENHGNYSRDALVFMLQCTSPFRSVKSLRGALYTYREIKEDNDHTIISVVNANKRCTYVDLHTTYKKRTFIVPQFIDNPAMSPNSYRVNGAIFGTTIRNLVNKRAFVKDIWSVPFEMDQVESIEIDTLEDLALARAVAKGLAS
jgi:CMP-N,N'-diacetyllegionaminic acid synthase